MQALIHIVLIAVLVQMQITRDRPTLWAGIYAAGWTAFRLPFALGDTGTLASLLGGLAAVLLAAGIFFHLLSRLDDTLGWWITVVVGNALVFIAGEAGIGLLTAEEPSGAA